MDRPLQRRLRDTHRNNTQRRAVTNDNKASGWWSLRLMTWCLCTIQKDGLPTARREITYWFAKQDPKRLLQEEMNFLQNLNTWRPTEKWKVPKYHLQLVQTEKKDIDRLIQFYLRWEKKDKLSVSVSCGRLRCEYRRQKKAMHLMCITCQFFRTHFSLLPCIVTRKLEFDCSKSPLAHPPICKWLVVFIQINQSEFWILPPSLSRPLDILHPLLPCDATGHKSPLSKTRTLTG